MFNVKILTLSSDDVSSGVTIIAPFTELMLTSSSLVLSSIRTAFAFNVTQAMEGVKYNGQA